MTTPSSSNDDAIRAGAEPVPSSGAETRSPSGTGRAAWIRPRLEEHGSVESLTQMLAGGPDDGGGGGRGSGPV